MLQEAGLQNQPGIGITDKSEADGSVTDKARKKWKVGKRPKSGEARKKEGKLSATFPYAYDPMAPYPDKLQFLIDELERRHTAAEAMANQRRNAELAFEDASNYIFQVVGRAMLTMQSFELTLGSILIGVATTSGEVTTPKEAEDFVAAVEAKTCGTLRKELLQVMDIDSHGLNILSRALKARNRLVHGFFERHLKDVWSHEGRQAMLAEVVEAMRVVELADNMLNAASDILLERMGYRRDLPFNLAIEVMESGLKRR